MATKDKSSDDCYFYYYSTCMKGDDCPFRHCEAALGTETVCSLWKEGRCYRKVCKFRHMESRKNRAVIPCYWENQPGGCRKPHCVFFHAKPRGNITEALTDKSAEGLILPLAAHTISSPSSSPAHITGSEPPSLPEDSSVNYPRSPENSTAVAPSVAPLVVTLEEESDADSTASTSIKPPSLNFQNTTGGARRVSLKKQYGTETKDEMDFGVKTLEQIRMEKMHKESEYIYNTDLELNIENAFLPSDNESEPDSADLRRHLKRKRQIDSPDTESTRRRRIILRMGQENDEIPTTVAMEETPYVDSNPRNLDFVIKTLSEIRQEREFRKDETSLSTGETALAPFRHPTVPDLPDSHRHSSRSSLQNQQLHFINKRRITLNRSGKVVPTKVPVSETGDLAVPEMLHEISEESAVTNRIETELQSVLVDSADICQSDISQSNEKAINCKSPDSGKAAAQVISEQMTIPCPYQQHSRNLRAKRSPRHTRNQIQQSWHHQNNPMLSQSDSLPSPEVMDVTTAGPLTVPSKDMEDDWRDPVCKVGDDTNARTEPVMMIMSGAAEPQSGTNQPNAEGNSVVMTSVPDEVQVIKYSNTGAANSGKSVSGYRRHSVRLSRSSKSSMDEDFEDLFLDAEGDLGGLDTEDKGNDELIMELEAMINT